MEIAKERAHHALKILALAGLLVLSLLAPPHAIAQTGNEEGGCIAAAVVKCENWEDRATGNGDLATSKYKNGPWFVSNSTNMTVVTTEHFTGTKAIQMHMNPVAEGVNGGGGFMDTYPPKGLTELYIRWYTKWSANFVTSMTATKQMTFSNSAFSGNEVHLGHSPFGSRLLNVVTQDAGGRTMTQNIVPGTSWTNNTWFCFEYRIKMNTTTASSDGIVQGWVNDVLTLSYSDVLFKNVTPLDVGFFRITTSGFDGPVGGSPAQDRWHDNIMMSTSRIGCVGTQPPPPPPPPPGTPTGVTITWLQRIWRSLMPASALAAAGCARSGGPVREDRLMPAAFDGRPPLPARCGLREGS
jgi:hypothetical protein